MCVQQQRRTGRRGANDCVQCVKCSCQHVAETTQNHNGVEKANKCVQSATAHVRIGGHNNGFCRCAQSRKEQQQQQQQQQQPFVFLISKKEWNMQNSKTLRSPPSLSFYKCSLQAAANSTGQRNKKKYKQHKTIKTLN